MDKLSSLLLSARAARLFWLVWGLLALYHLGGIARNGRYVPVSGRPGLMLDTRSGEVLPINLK